MQLLGHDISQPLEQELEGEQCAMQSVGRGVRLAQQIPNRLDPVRLKQKRAERTRCNLPNMPKAAVKVGCYEVEKCILELFGRACAPNYIQRREHRLGCDDDTLLRRDGGLAQLEEVHYHCREVLVLVPGDPCRASIPASLHGCFALIGAEQAIDETS